MKEKKIHIVKLKCVIDSKDIEFSEIYDTRDLTKDKVYTMLRFNDEKDDNNFIQFEILNDKGLPYWYDSTLFEIIHE